MNTLLIALMMMGAPDGAEPGAAAAEPKAEATATPEAAAPVEAPLAVEITPGLEARPRIEKTFMGNIGSNPANGNFRATQRTRAAIKAKAGSVSGYVSVQDVRGWGSEGNTLGDFSGDGIDFHEGWLQLEGDGYALRAGRQEFVLDGQRLIGAVNWAQQARSFDGLRFSYGKKDSYTLTAFAALAPDGGDHGLYVVHGNMNLGDIQLSIPLIVQSNYGILAKDRGARDANWTQFTAGLYAKGKGAIDWRVEGYIQNAGADHFAMLFGVRAGYKLSDALHPVLWVDYLSGGAKGAFDTLYATNHKFYGFMDHFLNIPVHTKNGGLIDIALKNTGKLGPGKLAFAAHLFSRAGEAGDGKKGLIGAEVDFVYTIPINAKMKFQVGEGLFFDMGEFAEGRNRTVHDWFFGQLMVKI